MWRQCLSLTAMLCALTVLASASGPSVDQVAQLLATNNQSTDYFGSATAVSRDGNTMAAGAWWSNGTAGQIYVYEKPSGGWTTMNQTARLYPTHQCYLGTNVVISDDGGTIAAFGGACSGGGFLGYGWIEVFVRPASGWTDMTEPTASLYAGSANDVGVYLSISPDGKTIATTGDLPAKNRSYVFLFDRPATGWTNMNHPTNSVLLSTQEALGEAIAINASQTIAVTSHVDNSVHVFQRSASGTQQVATLTPSDGAALCCTLAMDTRDIVVHAYASGSYEGKVYLFAEPASGWKNTTETAQFTVPNIGEFAYLGYSFAKSGNALLIGGSYVSAAYLFLRPAGGWKTTSQPDVTILSNDPYQSTFGDSVSMVGSTLLIGDGNQGANGNQNGAAYVFQMR